jgi:hypothetical protein
LAESVEKSRSCKKVSDRENVTMTTEEAEVPTNKGPRLAQELMAMANSRKSQLYLTLEDTDRKPRGRAFPARGICLYGDTLQAIRRNILLIVALTN